MFTVGLVGTVADTFYLDTKLRIPICLWLSINEHVVRISWTTLVVYSRDHKGVCVAKKIMSPKNSALFFPDDDQTVLV